MSRSDLYFASKDDLGDLNRAAARSGAVTMGAQAVRFAIQTASTMILARLLAPEDFGLVGMVTVLMQFVLFFRDFGLTQATVQRPTINRSQISNLFWFNVAASVGIAALFALSAPFVALFFKRQELTAVTLVLSISVLVEGVGFQHRALLMRAMQFTRLAAVDITAQLIAATIAIGMGFAGMRHWALVALYVSGSVFSTSFLCLATRWMPSRPRRNVGTKPFLTYGGNIFGFNLVNYFSTNTDSILVGRFAGAKELGYYGNAFRFILLPISQISGPLNQVFMASLARLQTERARFAETYYRFMLMLSLMTMPAVMFVVSTADNLIPVLLGPGWGRTALLLQAMALAGLSNALNISAGLVLAATGRSGTLFRLGIFNAVVIVAGYAVGVRFGALGDALSMSITQPPLYLLAWHVAYKGTDITIPGMLKSIGVPLAGAILAAGVGYLFIRFVWHAESALLNVVAQGALFAVIYCAFIFAFPRARRSVRESVGLILRRKPVTES